MSLTVIPSRFLPFEGSVDETLNSDLILLDTSQKRFAFKIKTNAPKDAVCASPSSGVVEPGHKRTIKVALAPLKTAVKQPPFQIQVLSLELTPQLENSEDVWKKAPWKMISIEQLMICFVDKKKAETTSGPVFNFAPVPSTVHLFGGTAFTKTKIPVRKQVISSKAFAAGHGQEKKKEFVPTNVKARVKAWKHVRRNSGKSEHHAPLVDQPRGWMKEVVHEAKDPNVDENVCWERTILPACDDWNKHPEDDLNKNVNLNDKEKPTVWGDNQQNNGWGSSGDDNWGDNQQNNVCDQKASNDNWGDTAPPPAVNNDQGQDWNQNQNQNGDDWNQNAGSWDDPNWNNQNIPNQNQQQVDVNANGDYTENKTVRDGDILYKMWRETILYAVVIFIFGVLLGRGGF